MWFLSHFVHRSIVCCTVTSVVYLVVANVRNRWDVLLFRVPVLRRCRMRKLQYSHSASPTPSSAGHLDFLEQTAQSLQSEKSSSMPGKKPSSRMLSEHVRTPCLIRRTPSVLRRCGFAVTLSCRSGVICLAFVGLCIHEHGDYRCLFQHRVMRVVVLVDSFGNRKFCVYLQSAWSLKYSVSLELSDGLRGS